jgi:hypothetical protein
MELWSADPNKGWTQNQCLCQQRGMFNVSEGHSCLLGNSCQSFAHQSFGPRNLFTSQQLNSSCPCWPRRESTGGHHRHAEDGTEPSVSFISEIYDPRQAMLLLFLEN